MIRMFEDRLRASDLSSDFRERMEKTMREAIRDDVDLMDEITTEIEEDNKDDVEGRVSNKDLIDLKIDEMASDAVDRIKLYVEFDLEAKL